MKNKTAIFFRIVNFLKDVTFCKEHFKKVSTIFIIVYVSNLQSLLNVQTKLRFVTGSIGSRKAERNSANFC